MNDKLLKVRCPHCQRRTCMSNADLERFQAEGPFDRPMTCENCGLLFRTLDIAKSGYTIVNASDPIPVEEQCRWLVCQQGGSTNEWYVRLHHTQTDAHEDRKSCGNAAYTTSVPIQVPSFLVDTEEKLYALIDLIQGRIRECVSIS